MKRIWSRGLALLLTLAFVAGCVPFAVSAEEDGFVYTVADGAAIITDYTGSARDLVIPDTLGGYPVTEIEAFAFDESKMVSVVIPGSVKRIGGGAFYFCQELTYVTLSQGLELIEEMAFSDCAALTEICIPASVTQLSPEMFSGCDSMTSLVVEEGCEKYFSSGNCIIEKDTGVLLQGCSVSVIPDDGSVKKIGANAFASARNLTSIASPYGVTEIGSYAFDSTALTELYIPASVKKVGKFIVYYSSVTHVYCAATSTPSGWDSKWLAGVDAEVVWGECHHEVVVSERKDPTCISQGYYKEICTICGMELAYQTYPMSSTHSYVDGVCSVCGKVAQMVRPGDVNQDGRYSAYDYVLLKRVLCGEYSLREASWVYADVSVNGRLDAYDYVLMKQYILGVSPAPELVSEDKVILGHDYKDRYGDAIVRMFEHESGSNTSYVYGAGEEVVAGAHVWDKLETVTLKSGVTGIGDAAFAGCEFLYEIYIPASVEYVGAYAFADSGVTEIYIQAESLPGGWDADWLKNCNATVHWGVQPPCDHTKNKEWVTVSAATCTEKGVEHLLCADCGEVLEERITPELGHHGVVQLGREATCTQEGLDHLYCNGCDSTLKYEVIPAKGHVPGAYRVVREPSCTKTGIKGTCCEICGEPLDYEETPAKGHSYGKDGRCTVCGASRGDAHSDFAFEITDEGVIITGYVGDKDNVKIPAEIQGLPVIKIGDAAFESKSLHSVSFPSTLREIGMFAFENCKSLKKVSIPGSVKLIGGSAFMDCTSLESVFLGEGIETICSGAFSGCVKLTAIQFPASVQVLEDSVLLGCDSLKHLGVAPGNIVFYSVDNCIIERATGTLLIGCATSVIPEDGSVTVIGDGAFSCVKGLKNLTIPDCITTISKDAFRSSDLEYLYIPASVTKMGNYVFFDMPALKAIYCEAKEAPAGWADKWNSGCTAEIIWDYTVCKHEYTYISAMCEATCEEGGYIVYSCRSCSEVVERKEFAATGHKYNKKHKCENCGNVEGLEIQMMVGYVIVVGYQGDATALELPEEIEGLPVMGIQAGAFAGNTKLTSVYIPATVESVEAGAFDGCENLTEIRCETDSLPSTWAEDWAGDADAQVAWESAPKPTILYGDVSGDNRIAMIDYVLLKRFVMGTSRLTDAQLLSADVNRDGKVGMADYVLLKRHVMGTFTIKQDQ